MAEKKGSGTVTIFSYMSFAETFKSRRRAGIYGEVTMCLQYVRTRLQIATFPNEGTSHCFPFQGILISHFIMLLKLKMSSAGLVFGHRTQLGTTFNSTFDGPVVEGWGTTSFYQAPVEQYLHGYEAVIPRCYFC